jgi:hypothetical protein
LHCLCKLCALCAQPARGGTLPKSGAWDAKDPTAGDGFTIIFQKPSVEKEGGPLRIPHISSERPAGSLDNYSQKQPSAQSKKHTQSKMGNDRGPVSSYNLCVVITEVC